MGREGEKVCEGMRADVCVYCEVHVCIVHVCVCVCRLCVCSACVQVVCV